MPSEHADAQSGGAGRPLLLAAAFAAGSAATLATKALLHSRRMRKLDAEGSDEDLPTVLRAGLDLAIAATNQAAESLSRNEAATKDDEPAANRSR